MQLRNGTCSIMLNSSTTIIYSYKCIIGSDQSARKKTSDTGKKKNKDRRRLQWTGVFHPFYLNTVGAKVTEEIDLIKPHHQTTIKRLLLSHSRPLGTVLFWKDDVDGGKIFPSEGGPNWSECTVPLWGFYANFSCATTLYMSRWENSKKKKRRRHRDIAATTFFRSY